MDSRQIRQALENLEWDDIDGTHLVVVTQAAAEYADLLEASERVWWCVTERHPYEGEIICCSRMVDTDCGWRLLVTERKS